MMVAKQNTTANPWLAHTASIASIRHEVPGVATYELRFDDPQIAESYRFQPGQFNMLYLPGFGESAISISSDAENAGSLLHTVRVAGRVTQALARLQGDLALSEPEDWTDLLDEVDDADAIPLEIEEELADIHSQLSANRY